MAGKGGMESQVLIRFAQKLAGNEKKHRTAAMKKLRKWLTAKSQILNDGLSRDDFIKIWKGLHYCMWMSDKPLVQEELARTISDLINCFPHFPQALLFIDTFFKTECREWFGIDHLRLDKFMMLIRQVFRRMLNLLKSHKWKKLYIKQVTSMLAKQIITSAWDDNIPDGIRFHVADIYLEELDHADTELSTDRVHMFLEPYCVALTKMKINTLFNHIVKRIFIELINWEMQKAEIIEYNNQVRAAVAAAAEAGENEAKENAEDDEDDLKEQELPKHIQVDYKRLADRLFELGSDAACPGKNRTAIYGLVRRFSDLAEGKLPKRLTYDDIKHEKGISPKDIRRAAHELMELELKLEKQSSKALKKKRKKLKHRRAARRGNSAGEMDKDHESDQNIDDDDGDHGEGSDDEPSSKKRRTSIQDVISVEENSVGDENSKTFGANSSQETDRPSSKKIKKKKKQAPKISEDLPASSCDDFISENVINEYNEKQTVKSKENKKHKKEANDTTSCSFARKGSFEENFNDAESSMETANKPANSTSTNLVTERDPPQLKEDGDSYDVNTTKKEMSKNKCNKKKVKKQSHGKHLLDTSVSGLNKDEKIVFTGGLVSDSDEDTAPQSGGSAAINANVSNDTAVTPVIKKKPASEGALVSFTKVKRTPPAFVKRAIKKVSTPKTEPKKPSAKLVEDVAPGTSPSLSKKKVIFAMNKNRAQDFSESLMVSPVLPFDPKQKPDQGILRSSPAVSDSPAMKSPRTKLFLKRAKAADYF